MIIKDCSPSFVIYCKKCKHSETIHTSHRINNKFIGDTAKKLIVGFILSGCGFKDYNNVLASIDVRCCSSSTFNNVLKQLYHVIKAEYKEITTRNLLEVLHKREAIVITMDGSWSHRGFNANECTMIVFDAETQKILAVRIIQ